MTIVRRQTAKLEAEFDVQEFAEWAKDNLEPDDIFEEDDLAEWVRENCEPEDVFKEDDLTKWAQENGFTKVDA